MTECWILSAAHRNSEGSLNTSGDDETLANIALMIVSDNPDSASSDDDAAVDSAGGWTVQFKLWLTWEPRRAAFFQRQRSLRQSQHDLSPLSL